MNENNDNNNNLDYTQIFKDTWTDYCRESIKFFKYIDEKPLDKIDCLLLMLSGYAAAMRKALCDFSLATSKEEAQNIYDSINHLIARGHHE